MHAELTTYLHWSCKRPPTPNYTHLESDYPVCCLYTYITSTTYWRTYIYIFIYSDFSAYSNFSFIICIYIANQFKKPGSDYFGFRALRVPPSFIIQINNIRFSWIFGFHRVFQKLFSIKIFGSKFFSLRILSHRFDRIEILLYLSKNTSLKNSNWCQIPNSKPIFFFFGYYKYL